MGKIRKPRPGRAKRNEPVEDTSQEEEIPIDSKENAIQTVMDQLQAPNVEEKYCGLQTLALLIEDPSNVPQIIEQGLVKVAAPLLLDAASSVRNAAAGMLRNMSAVSMEICDSMVDQDAMTPLTCYFHEHTETWTPDSSSKTNTEDIDTFVQCINLLLNVCESSEIAIKYVGQTKILDILPRYLDLSVFGNYVVTAVLQCLIVVIEDNPIAMEKIKTNAERQLTILLSLEGNEPSMLLVKTLSAGVIINACSGNIASLPVDVINQIISILATTLGVDHRLACNQISSNVPLSNAAGKVEPPTGKEAQILDNQIKAILDILDAQQSAIEIITNICSCEDNDGDDNDNAQGDDSSESDEMEDDQNQCMNENCTVLAEDRLPPQVLEALISLQLFEKVWARTQVPAQNVLLILKEYEGSQLIHKKVHTLQTRSLLCINNMLSALPAEALGGVSGLYKMWTEAGKLVFTENEDNVNLSESATAVMRAALDKMKLNENGNAGDGSFFKDLRIRECLVPEIRSNLLRMLGSLALLLVTNLNETNTDTVLVQAITQFILEQAHKENDVWVLAEAVDTIIDLYSEDETDVIAAKEDLVQKLTILLPVLKLKARQQKKLPKKYKVLVSTALTNLPRFIKYKRDRVSKVSLD
ncbi:71 kDa protein [Operophtera brumata]|uniref:71 kDa protein n=1 Tax=Operophtera brumata TaxID=104452 RepID=A0A0L7L8I3_OPEBR|nr:71 kDa protein [Operophtera brumata]